MKKPGSLTLALAACIAVSCGGGPKSDALTEPYRISIDLSTIDRSAPFPAMSEMIEDIEYVKLEYVDSIPVGGVTGKPVITDEYIIFNDNSQGVLQYSRDGRFIRRMGHKGRGPGEYGHLAGVGLDSKRGVIYTLPAWGGNRINRYDLATGRHMEDMTITDEEGKPLKGYDIYGFERLSDDALILSRGRSMAVYFDGLPPGDVISFLVMDTPTARITDRENSTLYNGDLAGEVRILPTPVWRDSEGRINLYENLADTMFVVGADSSRTPRIIADFGGDKLESYASGARGTIISSAMESAYHIIFEVGMKEGKYISFDKTTGERRLAPKLDNWFFEGPVNDIDGGFTAMSAYDETLWWASYNAFDMVEKLTPEHFERVRASVKFPDRLEKLQALVATLTENDNPVIAIAHLKHDN
jgi:hypothetical protein